MPAATQSTWSASRITGINGMRPRRRHAPMLSDVQARPRRLCSGGGARSLVCPPRPAWVVGCPLVLWALRLACPGPEAPHGPALARLGPRPELCLVDCFSFALRVVCAVAWRGFQSKGLFGCAGFPTPTPAYCAGACAVVGAERRCPKLGASKAQAPIYASLPCRANRMGLRAPCE